MKVMMNQVQIRIPVMMLIFTLKIINLKIKVKFRTCYLIMLQDNGPGNINYDRFVKNNLGFHFNDQ